MEAPTVSRYRAGRARHISESLLRILFFLLCTGLFLYLLFGLWLTPMTVRGDSMSPGITDGDVLLIDRLGKYLHRPGRGSYIVFAGSEGETLMRIAGLPGETLEVTGGEVYVGGCHLNEDAYRERNPEGGTLMLLTVPEGCVLALPDSRVPIREDGSVRCAIVSLDEITGVPRVRISPVSRLCLYR